MAHFREGFFKGNCHRLVVNPTKAVLDKLPYRSPRHPKPQLRPKLNYYILSVLITFLKETGF